MASVSMKVKVPLALSLLAAAAVCVRYMQTQYPDHRPIGHLTGFSSYILSFIALPLIRRFFTIPEDDWNRDCEVEGLQKPVDIYRDDAGIPYIFAHNEFDAHFARAFVEYTERPFQYEFLRRVATGRLSEDFGEELLSVDYHTRVFADVDYLLYQLASWPPRNRALLDLTVKAINQALKLLPATPVEFALLRWSPTEWSVIDYLQVLQLFPLQLGRGYTIDYTRVALQHYLKKYWKAFDLKTPKDVPPINSEGPHPLLFDQQGRRMQMPPLPVLDDSWAKWRPADLKKMLQVLRSKKQQQTDGQQQQQQSPAADAPAAESFASSSSAPAAAAAANKETSGQVSHAGWSGSNAWAVSGRFTASGKPLLASDTHLQAQAPGFWMPMLVSVGPSKLLTSVATTQGEEQEQKNQQQQQQSRVTGVSPVGLATICIGHNGYSAWGSTVSHTDAADFYLITLNDAGTHYLYDGKWVPLRIRVEKFIVKGKSAPVVKVARYTHHGPLYSDSLPIFTELLHPGEAIALAAVAVRGSALLDYFPGLASAKTWKDILAAGVYDEKVGLTTLWATTDGDIGALVSGAIPVRSLPDERNQFQDGTSSAADWNGVLPQTKVPHVVNPPSGILGAGNSKIADDPGKLYGDVFTPGFRQRRVYEMLRELTAKGNLTVKDMIEMQNDEYSISGKTFRDYAMRTMLFAYNSSASAAAKQETAGQHGAIVRTICTEEGLSEEDGRWLYTTMGQWDGAMKVNSPAPTVCDIWQQWILQVLFKLHGFSDEALEIVLGTPKNQVWLPAFEILNHWTYNLLSALEKSDEVVTDVSSSERLLCRGAAATLKWLRLRYGNSPSSWNWGNLRARFIDHPIGGAVPLLQHTMSIGPLSWGGNFGTLKSHHVAAGVMTLEEPWNDAYTKALDTPVMRMVVDLSDVRNSYWSVLPGVSGWVGDKNYDNFAAGIAATTGTDHMRQMLWTDVQIEAAAVTHMKLLPKGQPSNLTKTTEDYKQADKEL